MAETLATGVIEIVGDARKLRASIEEAKSNLRTLGTGQRDISRAASQSIDRYIGQLRAQNDLIGKSAREQEIYRLALRGASNEQLKLADSALKFREAQERNAQSIQALRSGMIAFGAVAVAAIGAAVVAFQNLVKTAGSFQDLAEQTGDTAEAFASLAVSAHVGGIAMTEVASASVKLTKSLTGVDDESEAAGAALKALGIDIAQFKQLAPSDQIEQIAKALAGFEDSSQKAAVAVALFGKAGSQMLPFLKELATEQGRQAILSQEQIELADEYADKQARLQKQIELQAAAIATDFIPALNDLSGAFFDTVKQIIGLEDGMNQLERSRAIQDFATSAVRAFAVVIDGIDLLIRGFQLAGKSIAGFAASMEALRRGEFRQALVAAQALGEDLRNIVSRPLFSANLEGRISARQERQTNQTPPQDRARLAFEGAAKKKAAGAGIDDGAALRRAQLQSDLDEIRKAAEEQINVFQNSERILQALRSAALVDDREYFEAKRAFIQLNQQESERALQQEIDRLRRETSAIEAARQAALSAKDPKKLADADKELLENARKIADAQAKITKSQTDAAVATRINAIEQEAAAKRIRQAFEDAVEAAKHYIDTIARANAREIAGIGRGRAFRENQAGFTAIEDRLLNERRRLEGELRRGQLGQGQEARDRFNQYIAVAEDTYRREVELYQERTRAIEAAQADWLAGASEALRNYIDEVNDVSKQFEDVFSRGFKSAEDALLDLTSGGVKSFKDLGDAVHKFAFGIAQDLARIEIRRNITGPLAEWLQQNGRLEGIGNVLGFPARPGGAAGGLVDTGEPIQGAPAWLNALMGRKAPGDFVEGTIAKSGIPGFKDAANAAQFTTAVTTAGTTFATAATTAGTTVSAELTAAGAAQATEMTAAGAAFAAEVAAAGSAFAAAVASAGGGASGGAGLIGGVLDSFATGTRYVPQTGPYLLHQGERVVPASENMSGGGSGDINITVNMPSTDSATRTQTAVEIGRQVQLAQGRRFSGAMR